MIDPETVPWPVRFVRASQLRESGATAEVRQATQTETGQ